MDPDERGAATCIIIGFTVLFTIIGVLAYTIPGTNNQLNRHPTLKIRHDLFKSSNFSAAFDPLIRAMERFLINQQQFDIEYWALFNDFSNYVNDKDKFNVTNRLEVLFPQIKSDVHIADGYLSEHELTQWMLHQNHRWSVSEITHAENKYIQHVIQPHRADADILKLLKCLSTEQLRLTKEGKEVGMLNNLMAEYLRRFFKIEHEDYYFYRFGPRHEQPRFLYHRRDVPSEVYKRATEQAKHMIQEADVDEDGYLSLKEMIDKPYVFYNHCDDREELYPLFHCKNAS